MYIGTKTKVEIMGLTPLFKINDTVRTFGTNKLLKITDIILSYPNFDYILSNGRRYPQSGISRVIK